MTYAEEIGPVVKAGIAAGWIKDVTKLLEMPAWLLENPFAICPNCDGRGGTMQAMNDAPIDGYVIVQLGRCPACLGSGEVPYRCMN